MYKNLIIFLKSFVLIFVLISNLCAEELTLIPQKKPILDQITKQKKITQGIIKPKSKPIKEKKEKVVVEQTDRPKPKPSKETQEPKKGKGKKEQDIDVSKETQKITTKKISKDILIIPKIKPLIVKTEKSVTQLKSKYYSQKDFNISKKAIQAMEKKKWSTALSLSKKAKDKSIYNFIQWRHLLTKGNQASFYDYASFIKQNENYPRINRIKYLAEHKLSTKKISPKKITSWFGSEQPFSGK